VPADKGTATRSILSRSDAARALYAGDDTTDLDAFIGLQQAHLDYGVRVAVVSDEGPPELFEAADVLLAGPREVLALLRAL
jgi:trehalose 6-phosphate phosphatase